MKSFIAIAACCLVLSVSAFAPLRQRRDVSELAAASSADQQQPAYEYLPPEPKLLPVLEPEVVEIPTTEAPATTTTVAPEPSVRLGENGYEYRTVRRLKYRTRRLRDVSHLAQHYLPPTTAKVAPPARDYLPPTTTTTAPAPVAPIDDTEEVVAAPAPKVANDYLPPVQDAATEPIVVETEAPEEVEPAVRTVEEEEPQDTAVLADDGYHYKQPEQPFELKAASEAPAAPAVTPAAAQEYLPPLSDDTVAVEGPEDSAVLAADGYHYRAIRRLRF